MPVIKTTIFAVVMVYSISYFKTNIFTPALWAKFYFFILFFIYHFLLLFLGSIKTFFSSKSSTFWGLENFVFSAKEGCYISSSAICAFFCINSRRGPTSSPISIEKVSSAITASSIVTFLSILVLGFIVVSHN